MGLIARRPSHAFLITNTVTVTLSLQSNIHPHCPVRCNSRLFLAPSVDWKQNLNLDVKKSPCEQQKFNTDSNTFNTAADICTCNHDTIPSALTHSYLYFRSYVRHRLVWNILWAFGVLSTIIDFSVGLILFVHSRLWTMCTAVLEQWLLLVRICGNTLQ